MSAEKTTRALGTSESIAEQINMPADRRGLTTRTTFVRIVAGVGFGVFLLAVILANLFYGFSGTLELLLIMSIGHLLLSPLAILASLRLGYLLTWALGFAGLQLMLDVTQIIIRALRRAQTVEFFALLAVNVVLAAISLLYLVSLGRLRQADRELNNGIVDADAKAKRAAMVRQESNTLTAIPVFDLLLLFIVLIGALFMADLSLPAHRWLLFHLAHLAPIALGLLGLPGRGSGWTLVFLGVVLAVTALDLLAFTLRLLDRPDAVIEVFLLANIVTVVLLVVSAFYLFIDAIYIVVALGLYAALQMPIATTSETIESQAHTAVSPSKAATTVQMPMLVRRRG